ncbi:hypothetical protein ACFL3V_03160 [Nanoarchaeota archaeon]
MRTDASKRMLKLTILAVILLVLLSSSVLAIGIVPATKNIDFKPGQKVSYSVDIVNNAHEDLEVLLYTKGEFSKNLVFVTRGSQFGKMDANTKVLKMGEDEKARKVDVEFTMPDKIEVAGPHTVKIYAVGSTPAPEGEGAVVKADIAVISKLVIDVPYPDKYAEARVHVLDTQSGKPVEISVPVFNKGSEDIDEVYITVKVHSADGEIVDEMITGKQPLDKGDQTKFTVRASDAYPPGEYKAVAVVHYDGAVFEAESHFNIGDLLLELKGLVVEEFTLGGVARFDILLYNKWSSDLTNVHAEMQITGPDNKEYTKFKTVAVDIPSRELATLEGYWHTQDVFPGIYTAKVTLYYSNKISQKEFELEVQPNKIIAKELVVGRAISAQDAVDFQKSGFLVLIILVMAAVIGVLVYLLRRKQGLARAALTPGQQEVKAQKPPVEEAAGDDTAGEPKEVKVGTGPQDADSGSTGDEDG